MQVAKAHMDLDQWDESLSAFKKARLVRGGKSEGRRDSEAIAALWPDRWFGLFGEVSKSISFFCSFGPGAPRASNLCCAYSACVF